MTFHACLGGGQGGTMTLNYMNTQSERDPSSDSGTMSSATKRKQYPKKGTR